jgi:hypothetical protein
MATEEEAHKAREQHSDYLRKLGAHAIQVDQIRRGGRKTFAVVAHVEREPDEPPPGSLEVESGGKKKKVPLAVRVSPMAQLE